MKLTKYVHSCVLVEAKGRVGLIDPGNYSWESGLFKLEAIKQIDDLIITHEHQDHMHLPFVKAVIEKFPNVNIVTTDTAKKQLARARVGSVSTIGDEFIELFVANHESMEPLFTVDQNIGVHYLGVLSHPGDSHHFQSSKDILALPITAPWGTVARAVELGLSLHPKYIIPIHDWQYNEAARLGMYDRLADFFARHNINFLKPIDGQPIDLEL